MPSSHFKWPTSCLIAWPAQSRAMYLLPSRSIQWQNPHMTTDKFPIDVAASVIADISAGIYRSPAGALKELISNAFDADARVVRISTGAPHFNTFTCTDEGSGFTP